MRSKSCSDLSRTDITAITIIGIASTINVVRRPAASVSGPPA
ncbi:hypothetical protein I552_1118 [Mycobacterium xenopi 3993]|nr:hypothetical protein I552_1118 [Mycobacterium xenopi 3993]